MLHILKSFFLYKSGVNTRLKEYLNFLKDLFYKTFLLHKVESMLQADYQSADEAILSDEFAFHSSKKKIKLTLHANCIQIFKKEKNGKTSELDRVLQMDDVVGCSICQGQRKNDTKAYLSIYHYPRIDKGKFHSQRKRQVIEIACNKTNNFEDNLNVIREWSDKLTRALSRAIGNK